MDKERICKDYLSLTEKIIEVFSDRDVPTSIQSYYLLCELIAGGSEKYFVNTYGAHPLEIKTANEGKEALALGPLTDFEIGAAEFLNSYLKYQQEG